MFGKSAIYALCAGLLTTALATAAVAADNGNPRLNPRGVLDTPVRNLELPPQAANAAQQAAAARNIRAQARAERQQLRSQSEADLRRQARDESDRLAQLVLAEKLAEEAQRWAGVPSVGNDALGEALQWYAIAAKRGYPGTVAIDQVLPSFPVKVLRN